MADYYPLIARAIAGLDPSAPGESRRALYERARAALIAQLRSVQPPFSESEITRERLSLEEAVRKVESEAAQRARDASRAGGRSALRRRCLPPRQCRAHASAPTCAGRGRRTRHRIRARVRRRRLAMPRPPLGQDRRARRAIAPRRADGSSRVRRSRRSDAGSAAAADPRTIGRAAPRPRQYGAADAAAAGHARLPRHRRRRRRSRPRRRASQPRRAKDLCQRAVALAGIRPARAELGEPRRRSGRSPIPTTNRSRRPTATRRPPTMPPQRSRIGRRRRSRAEEARPRPARCFRSRARSRSASC